MKRTLGELVSLEELGFGSLAPAKQTLSVFLTSPGNHVSMRFELGLSTFVETTPDPETGEQRSHADRLREVVEEAVLAEEVGLDAYGVGEHHRADYACSAPAVVLAAIAARTKRLRLTSAVTVLSSDDPVRVFQAFSTVDALSDGRAEIMVGRGSFIESFPLFGQSLEDYDELFSEKLDLLLQLCRSERINWKGKHRSPIRDLGVYPRPVQTPLPVWVGSGGNQSSVVRAGKLGLPLALAIIGGRPEAFAPLVRLYRLAGKEAGHSREQLRVAVHSHGYVAESDQQAAQEFFPSTQRAMNIIGRERGWPPYDQAAFDAARSPQGALFCGSPSTVAAKIDRLRKALEVDRFLLHCPVGTMEPELVNRSIELYGGKVREQLPHSSHRSDS